MIGIIEAVVAGVGVVLALVGAWAMRRSGVQAERQRNAEARGKIQEKYDEIDRRPADPAGSYDRLRGLSGRDGRR